jgi:hypothetical protein
MAAQAALLQVVAERAETFDVLHFHIDWLHLPLFSRFTNTTSDDFSRPARCCRLSGLAAKFPRVPFVSIPDDQRLPLKQANWLGTV